MTEPTDDEIKALLPTVSLARNEEPKVQVWLTQKDAIAFARAVLERWGTPATGGEPIGYLLCGCASGDELPDWEINQLNLQFDKLNEHYAALGEEATLPLYTSPQPVRKPMPEDVAKLVQAAQAFVLEPNSLKKKIELEAQAWGPLADTPQPVREPLTIDIARMDEAMTGPHHTMPEGLSVENIAAHISNVAQPVREPLNIIELMRVVMKADEETRGNAIRGTTNWAAHIGKSVQNAVLGITGGQT